MFVAAFLSTLRVGSLCSGPIVLGGARMCSSSGSVSGILYAAPAEHPTVRLFTKAGCTLCDVAKDVLQQAAQQHPHTLESVDITDPEHEAFLRRYKYDIPVLHIGETYWTKHRLSLEEAEQALSEAREGRFIARRGEPDAERLERRKST
uniref:Glutaredoxin-like protein n=1 Tax=Coccolithus braarudii TaxID=221442 RepID=A0A7S0LDF2_9EUKA|mmetsp:Transcript_34560/g.73779  ORF Transcript_34560/g.73779 Transcript_34560/m.73779 type:complete len:149 (+) Transcript_34560:16-462(+)